MYLRIECTHCQSSLAPNTNSIESNLSCVYCENQETKLLEKKPRSQQVSKDIQVSHHPDQLNINLNWNKSLRSPFTPFSFRQVIHGILTFLALQTTMGFAFALNIPFLYIACTVLCFLWFYTFVYQPLPFLFNHINISVDSQFITINYGPLPNSFLYGKYQFAINDIQQLYIRRSKKKNSGKEKERKSYAICAVLKNRETISLIEPLISSSEALFLERKINHFLGF